MSFTPNDLLKIYVPFVRHADALSQLIRTVTHCRLQLSNSAVERTTGLQGEDAKTIAISLCNCKISPAQVACAE